MPPVEHSDLDALLKELAFRREAGDTPGAAQGCLTIASALIQRDDVNADAFLIEGLTLFRALNDQRGVAATLDWAAEAIRRREARAQAARTEEAVKALASLAPDDALAAALAFDPAADATGRQAIAARLEQAAGAIRERLAREEPVDPRVAELNARMRASGMFIAPDFGGALSEDDAVALALEALASDSP